MFVIDKDDEGFKVQYKMNIYHLWESQIKGFLSTANKDFVILNKEGINFIRLDPNNPRKAFDSREEEGTEKMVHSLGSMNYLKVEPGNMLYFENKLQNDDTLVYIQQQYTDLDGNMQYEDIFKIKLQSMDLENLILFQSLFLIESSQEILNLISNQPKNDMLFKSFMELDHANMV